MVKASGHVHGDGREQQVGWSADGVDGYGDESVSLSSSFKAGNVGMDSGPAVLAMLFQEKSEHGFRPMEVSFLEFFDRLTEINNPMFRS